MQTLAGDVQRALLSATREFFGVWSNIPKTLLGCLPISLHSKIKVVTSEIEDSTDNILPKCYINKISTYHRGTLLEHFG